jgi:hypothetical protein
MRVIDSALSLSDALQTSLKIYWVQDEGLNCPFHLLFKPIDRRDVTLIERRSYPFQWMQKSRRLREAINALPGPFIIFSAQENQKLQRYPFDIHRNKRRIFIQSFSRFQKSQHIYQDFVPIPELQARIDENRSQFDAHIIGVHIRRTDHQKSIDRSPDTLFIAHMQHALSLEPRTRFYLATDSQDTKRTFHDVFGDRIITTAKKAARDSIEGMQDALVELYTLASTSRLIGSYWSSFSVTAAEIGNIQHFVIKNE